MTQPVAPGARAACFEEPSAEPPIECTSPPPPVPFPWCAEGLAGFEYTAARSPPTAVPRDSPEPAGLRFCRKADTVVEGFLCDERAVVSDACRKPNNSFDAYICDEPRMNRLQGTVWDATLWIIKTLVSLANVRSKPR